LAYGQKFQLENENGDRVGKHCFGTEYQRPFLTNYC